MTIEDSKLRVTAFVFKIIHIRYGIQYVARVMYNGLTYNELVYNYVPSQDIIEDAVGIKLEECRFEPGLNDA
jgi:hypothetical protein